MKGLANLTNLEYLTLSQNQFTGSIPIGINTSTLLFNFRL